MYILVLIAVLAGAAFWWYRLRGIGIATGDIVDTTEWLDGAIRRRNIRRGAELSPITAIDDPVIAAGVILAAFAGLRPGPGREEAVRDALLSIAGAAAADEAVRYGFWANAQFADSLTVVAETATLATSWLDTKERAHLVEMAVAVARATRAPPGAAVRHAELLRRKFGLRPD